MKILKKNLGLKGSCINEGEKMVIGFTQNLSINQLKDVMP